jgi:hypothetical protein
MKLERSTYFEAGLFSVDHLEIIFDCGQFQLLIGVENEDS